MPQGLSHRTRCAGITRSRIKTGLNIVASLRSLPEKFESQRIHKTVDELAATIDKELNQGIGDTDIRAGMIGEIGVSPTFTEAEHNSLRALAGTD